MAIRNDGCVKALRAPCAALVLFAVAFPASAAAAEPPAESEATREPPVSSATATAEPTADGTSSAAAAVDVRAQVPSFAYAYSASGAAPRTLGAQTYGLGVAATRQKGIVGGGISVWGSPIDRLTIIGDAQRDTFGNFAPSLAIVGRILGKRDDGWSLGALGKFKMEGFGSGKPIGVGTPPTKPGEVESEIEAGVLLSYARRGGVHLDLNAVTGMGTGDDGEVDSEARVRVGYDVTSDFRLGIDGQARVRLNGPKYLPNGEIWDFSFGPQAIVALDHVFIAATAGPTTTGLLTDHLGWNAIIAAGASTF